MNKPTIVKITRSTEACPAQWDGETNNGEYVYIRYRFGTLRAGMGKTESEMWNRTKEDGTCDVYNMFQKTIGEHLDGWMEYQTMKNHLSDVFNFPEKEINPFEEAIEENGDVLF